VLASYRDKRVKATEQTLVAALTGDYRREHLFCLQQAYAAYQFTEQQIAAVDQELATELARLAPAPAIGDAAPPPSPRRPKASIKHPPAYPAQTRLASLCGVDLTTIPGIQVLTAHTIWAELGSDLSAFPRQSIFAPGSVCAPTTEPVRASVCRPKPGCPPIASRTRSAWPRKVATTPSTHWATTTAACAPSWAPSKACRHRAQNRPHPLRGYDHSPTYDPTFTNMHCCKLNAATSPTSLPRQKTRFQLVPNQQTV